MFITLLFGTMKTVFSILAFALFSLVLQAKVFYVVPGAEGDGFSWTSAAGDLAAVLLQAQFGDEVWVAAGIYTPTRDNDRTKSFILPDGVQVYGGFSGVETSRDQRNWLTHRTVLSGEIGATGIKDNSYNVVYTRNVSAATVLDGFIITHGNAGDRGESGDRPRSGGGWYNDGSNGQSSSPTIRNCIFESNIAVDGGGFYNNGQNGLAQPTFENTLFRTNRANLDGGGIFSDARNQGKSYPRFFYCSFEKNVASYGAAIFTNSTGRGFCQLLLEDCQLLGNTAYILGAVYSFPSELALDLTINRTIFQDNYPTDINRVSYQVFVTTNRF